MAIKLSQSKIFRQIKFRITDAKTGQNKNDLKGVELSASDLADEKWSFKTEAKFVGDGVYEFDFTSPKYETYFFAVQIKSLNIGLHGLPIKIVRSR